MLNERDLVKTLTTEAVTERTTFFLKTLAKEKSKATVNTYRRSLGVFARWIDEQGGSIELFQQKLEEYPLYLSQRRRVSTNTIRTYIAALRQFFIFLSKEGLLNHDPLRNIKVNISKSPKSWDILTKDEIKSLFRVSIGDEPIELRDRAILCCMLNEGLSESDVSRTNYKDLEHTLMGEELLVRGKGVPMRIRLDSQTYQSLRDYLRTRERPIRPDEPLFVSHGPRGRNDRLKVRTIRFRMRALLDRANITRVSVSPLSLVHTSMYLLIQKGITRQQLRERTRPWRLYHRLLDLKARGLIDSSF